MAKASNEYMNNYMKNRWKLRRERYISQLGGKCTDCGSSENLEFEHIDPFTKNFAISSASSFSEKRVQEELKLCILRCTTCHKSKSRTDGSDFKNRRNGEDIHFAKLSEQQAVEILHAEGTHKSISEKYKVSRPTVSQIKSRKTWKHI